MSLSPLTSETETEALVVAGPAWILKHSNACPVSFAALEQVESHLATSPGPAGMITVQTHRPLSNWLATRLGFVHQSPQLFLVAGGKVLWQASHWGITREAMQAAMRSVERATRNG
jgi:bacillithiol system protein YtxJ